MQVRVKKGHLISAIVAGARVEYKEGDVFELSDAAVKAFSDKVDIVSTESAEPAEPVESTESDTQGAESKPAEGDDDDDSGGESESEQPKGNRWIPGGN